MMSKIHFNRRKWLDISYIKNHFLMLEIHFLVRKFHFLILEIHLLIIETINNYKIYYNSNL